MKVTLICCTMTMVFIIIVTADFATVVYIIITIVLWVAFLMMNVTMKFNVVIYSILATNISSLHFVSYNNNFLCFYWCCYLK